MIQIINHNPNRVKNSPVTTIVVPAYNEEKGLEVVLGKIFCTIDDSYEVIVVDDGSKDNTVSVAGKFPVTVIRHEINLGKGEALKSAISEAGGENVVWIDADDTYPASLIPDIVKALEVEDMVVCSRIRGKENIPLVNRFGSFVLRNLLKGIYGFKPYDPFTGLYAVKRRHLEKMKLACHRFAIEPEISIKSSRMKLKAREIPIQYGKRVGETKLNSIVVGFEDLWTIIKLVFWRPEA